MQRITYSGVLVILIFGFFFISTLLGSNEVVIIPLDQPDLYQGEISLTIPQHLFAGQKRMVRARITLVQIPAAEFSSIVSSRLEMGVDAITPRGTVQVNLQPGVPVEMNWELRVWDAEVYRGTLWVSVENSGKQHMLMARDIEIESRYFLGTRVENIRILSGLFIGVGCIIVIFGLVKQKMKNIEYPA